MISQSQKAKEAEQIQVALRQELNPQWEAQRKLHDQVLGISGPQKKLAWDMLPSRRKRKKYR